MLSLNMSIYRLMKKQILKIELRITHTYTYKAINREIVDNRKIGISNLKIYMISLVVIILCNYCLVAFSLLLLR